ncbi:MAG: hypothetical protein SOS24_06525 [Clostridia bacterium]|nr:hypothetical protein [Clostridia bacterium]
MKTPKKEKTYVLSISAGKGCYRHLKISSKATLYDLHEEILDAFNFIDDHAHVFFMNNHAWDDSAAYYCDFIDEAEYFTDDAKLEDFNLQKDDKFLYIFDFGEEWRFQIRVLREESAVVIAPEIIKAVGEPPIQYI